MSTLAVNTISGQTAANSVVVTGEGGTVTTSLQQGLSKCWVNFDGRGTIAARDSLNFTSLTDNATGDYSITIANDMANANYVHAGDSGGINGSSIGVVYANDQSTARTTTLFRVYTLDASATPKDPAQVNIIVCGDLA